MKIIKLTKTQYKIAKKLGVPVKPLMQEQNYWLLFIVCTWLLLLISIVIWK